MFNLTIFKFMTKKTSYQIVIILYHSYTIGKDKYEN